MKEGERMKEVEDRIKNGGFKIEEIMVIERKI